MSGAKLLRSVLAVGVMACVVPAAEAGHWVVGYPAPVAVGPVYAAPVPVGVVQPVVVARPVYAVPMTPVYATPVYAAPVYAAPAPVVVAPYARTKVHVGPFGGVKVRTRYY